MKEFINNKSGDKELFEISIEEFDSIVEEHEFSKNYKNRKKHLLKEARKHKYKKLGKLSFQGIAAAIAICVILPVGAYAAFSHKDFIEETFGNKVRDSVEKEKEYVIEEEKDYWVDLPQKEYVPVDVDKAEELIGDCIMDTPIVKEIKDYKFTILSAVRDEDFMVMKFTLEQKGGVDVLKYDEKTNRSYGAEFSDNTKLIFSIEGGYEYIYVDTSKSTSDKLYCYDYIILDQSLPEGRDLLFEIEYSDEPIFTDLNSSMQSEVLAIPVNKTVKSIKYTSSENGELDITPIGMILSTTNGLGFDKITDHDPYYIREITVNYKDGNKYVVIDRDNDIDNMGNSVGDMRANKFYILFNRIVYVDEIDNITINGISYKAE